MCYLRGHERRLPAVASTASRHHRAYAFEKTQPFDLCHGRVLDPESGLDAVRHLGIRGGKIEAVSETPLTGVRAIDASRHVVSPGFIDLHEHGQQEESYRMMVRDGVTSAFELEVGTGDVAAWYAARDAGQIVNYGVSVGHIPARMTVLGDPGKGLLPAGIGGSGTATDAQMAAMERFCSGAAEGRSHDSARLYAGAPMSDRNACPRRGRGGVAAHIHCAGGCQLKETSPGRRARAPCTLSMSNHRGTIDGFSHGDQSARDAGGLDHQAYPYGAGMPEIHRRCRRRQTWPDAGSDCTSSAREPPRRRSASRARPVGR